MIGPLRHIRLTTRLFLILVIGAVSCNQTETPRTEASGPAPVEEPAAPAQKHITMAGMDLYMHDYSPTAGEVRKPTFWVHAAKGELIEENQIWALTHTKAIVYRRGEEDLILEAAFGLFDEANKIAHLNGNVRIHTASMDMEMAQIQWDNEASVVRSLEPLDLIAGNTRLHAAGVILRPEDGTYELSEVSGRVAFEEKSL